MSKHPREFTMAAILNLTSGSDANDQSRVIWSLALIVQRQDERIARLEARLAAVPWSEANRD